jgi:hypothetical protein
MTTPLNPEKGPKLIVTRLPLVSDTCSPDLDYGRNARGEMVRPPVEILDLPWRSTVTPSPIQNPVAM